MSKIQKPLQKIQVETGSVRTIIKLSKVHPQRICYHIDHKWATDAFLLQKHNIWKRLDLSSDVMWWTLFVFCFQAEDDSSKLTYSELNFSNRTVGSRNSALRGHGDDVVYSVPRVEASSEADDDLSVYSTVT